MIGRALITFLLTAVTALAIAGCGKENVSLDRAVRAAEATTREGTFKSSYAMVFEDPELGRVTAGGSADYDMRRGRGRMVMDLGSFMQQAGAPAGMQDFEIEMLFDGLTLYLEVPEGLPEADREFAQGKPWVKFDLERSTKELGLDLDSLMQMSGGSPQNMVDQLKAMTGELERVGTEEVRGVETTHYKGTIDMRKFADVVPPKMRPLMRKSTDEMIDEMGRATFPAELWIDGDDLLRRERYSFSIPKEKLEMTVTADFFDYGAPVDVDPPPAEDVHDVTEQFENEMDTP